MNETVIEEVCHKLFEVVNDMLMNTHAKILHSAVRASKNDRSTVIRNLSLRLGVAVQKKKKVNEHIQRDRCEVMENTNIRMRSRSFQICSTSSSRFHSR